MLVLWLKMLLGLKTLLGLQTVVGLKILLWLKMLLGYAQYRGNLCYKSYGNFGRKQVIFPCLYIILCSSLIYI